MADRAYSSRANRAWLREHQIRATIPEPADQIANRRLRGATGGRPPAFDADRYKERSTTERTIARLKQHRALATRYDKLAVRYLATVQIAVNHQTQSRPGAPPTDPRLPTHRQTQRTHQTCIAKRAEPLQVRPVSDLSRDHTVGPTLAYSNPTPS
ncbi:hypothetical protein GCM10010403_15730 [Glycomyces rutgersensis]|uniref:Transposase DDE domain-containing protein n=1 Tax=Glycomyces rutgersensis TaxID=58115 RepID=A0ABP5S7J1_9ACTN